MNGVRVVRLQTEQQVKEKQKAVVEQEQQKVLKVIDQATKWDQELKELKKNLDKAKEFLKEHAGENGWRTLSGEYGLCEIRPSSSSSISPTALAKVLKKMDKLSLYETVVKVQVGEAKKYLGEEALKDIMKVSTEEVGSMSLRPLKK